MNQNPSAERNLVAGEGAGAINSQGIKFLPFHAPPQKLEAKQETKGVFVRNIPKDLTNKELRHIFSEYGKVVSVYLKPITPGAKYSWAIINVETSRDLLAIMSALNKKPPFYFDVSLALTEEQKKQRKAPNGGMDLSSCDDTWTYDKGELSGPPLPCPSTMGAQGALNGGTTYGSQGLVRREAEQQQGLLSEEKVKVSVPVPSRNESYEVGKGTAVVAASRKQLCVFCGVLGHMRCSVCKAWYCSMVCQVDDWYHHKETCRSPPVLDDPVKVHRSLCGAGGEAPGASDTVLPASPVLADGCEKDLHRGMLKEGGACCSPKKTLDNETQPRGNIASSPGGDTALTKRSSATENGFSSGAITGSIVEHNDHGIGRGAIPKRSTVAPSSNLIGYDGTSKPSFRVGSCLGVAPKGSLVTENGPGRGRGVTLQRDEENFAVSNGPVGGRGVNPQRNVEEKFAGESGLARGRASILQMHVEEGPAIEIGPARGRGAILQKDVELVASRRNPSEVLPPNHRKIERITEEEEELPKPSTAKEIVTPGTDEGTPTECSSSVKAASSTHKEESNPSPEVSSTKNVIEGKPNFASLLEKGKVYNGFITLVDSYKHFTAAVVVDGTEYIFSEAHETLGNTPFRGDFRPEVGSVVAAFSSIEQTWYRAQVLQADHPKYKVCFIDFGNKEEVEKVKTIPEGPFAELPELAFSARFFSGLKDDFEGQLKIMIKADSPIKFKVTAKKQFSVKVSLCEDDDENDTPVAEYILEQLLPRSFSAQTSEVKATSVEVKAAQETKAQETKAISQETRAISQETKASSQESKASFLETKAIALEKMANFPKTKAIFPEMASFPETKASPQEKPSSPEAKATSPETKSASPDTKAASLDAEPTPPHSEAGQQAAPATGQQGSALLEKDKEDQVLAVSGVQKDREAVDVERDALKDNSSSSQSVTRDADSESSSSGAGKAHSFYVVPLNTLELMMQMEEMAVELNKYCESAPSGPHQPRLGEVCLAKFSQDGNWYRAVCVTLGSTSAVVVFVDYGNVDKVLYTDMRKIPKQFLELPCFALHRPRPDSDTSKMLEPGQTSVLSAFAFLSPLNMPPEGIIKTA
ncbi:uncharacterized protein LOC126983254 isoform X2 [Eriocheir sinensis]|uniref:uncharacterized protein LOC126983254 isoform X2 n=1 Tax=Eriocheir sinensis TaxID=95602 RepID=UPI0021C6E977|nr:uncharacterized protein LOC126983254 isoform X2 [Eriocheir sinensis]